MSHPRPAVPGPQATPQPPSAAPDPLQDAEAALQSLPGVPLDRHAEVFAHIDTHLRKALDGAGTPGRG